MLGKMISERIESIVTPARNEIRLAQEQAIERIQNVLAKAEKDVAEEGRFMNPEQRLQTAENELEKAEAHLLSALGSMFKALYYVAPQMTPFGAIQPIKDIEAEVIPSIENTNQKKKWALFKR